MNDFIEQNALIPVSNENGNLMVSARDLHQKLEIKTPYRMWFPRMCEYGFEENRDFRTENKNVLRADGAEMPQKSADHMISLSMAKELCMLQRTEKGKFFRQYFIKVEEAWNSPEAILSRALQIAGEKVRRLEEATGQLKEQVALMEPKASYYDMVLACKDLLPTTAIAKDYGMSARQLNRMLADRGIQYRLGSRWVLNQKYAGEEYCGSKTFAKFDVNGVPMCEVHSYWTQKGRLFIYDLLKKEGIVPVMERLSA